MIEFIKEIATRFYLKDWDWIAVSIAFFSLIVAFISIMIAMRTLKSQRQTEKNTMPIINMKIQEFLLNELFLKLFDGQLMITALWYLLNDKKYELYPSEQILEKIKMPVTHIHSELFYKNYKSYRTIAGLVDMVNEYNIAITTLNNHLHDNAINKEILYREFSNLTHINDRIANILSKILSLLFNYDTSKISRIFVPFIDNISQNDVDNLELKYYRQDDVYATFLQIPIDQNKLLFFMESRTAVFYNDFKLLLIKKISDKPCI